MNEHILQPVNILLADDHQMIIDGLKSMIGSQSGFRVVAEARNGRLALDLIEQNPGDYDLLLTDISMPEMDGLVLCREVRTRQFNIKVLVLSMYNNAAIVRDCIAAEADGFILKDSSREELFLALHKIARSGTYFSSEVLPLVLQQHEKTLQNREKLNILTAREQEVLQLIVQEFTSEEIAQKLFISRKTVDHHRASILSKTGCKSTIGLVKFALQHQI